MRTQLLLASLLATTLLPSRTQAQTTWIQNYPMTQSPFWDKDGRFSFVGKHPSGDFLLVSNQVQNGVQVQRIDAQGNTVWSKVTPIVRSGRAVYPNVKFSQDAQGNILITHPNGLAKLNLNGDTAWTRPFAPTGDPNGTIASIMLSGPDDNYLVVRQLYTEPVAGTPMLLEVRARKIDAATGQDIWNTDLTPLLTGTNYGSYGPWPKLARRSSGYFVFINGSTISLPENGSAPTMSANTLGNISTTLYTRVGTTIVAGSSQLRVLNDQGNVVATSPSVSTSATGGFTALTEDTQGRIIGVMEGENSTAPGQGGDYVMSLLRFPSGLQLLENTLDLRLTPTAFVGGSQFSVTVAPDGQYALGGATYTARSRGGSRQMTLALVPAFAPLATKALATGTLGLYPNPGAAQGSVTVHPPAAGTLGLYDLLGRPCLPAQTVTGSAVILPLPELAAGVYVLRLNSPDGRNWTDRLTVQ
ncbi:T9SS type A sorting domain-containing protein [Hymenobacter sp. 15J16-1T3B]|uniref:T9SS type A sorting domain-containing protein n=1 Tax=Hymenobacter sp. 15J16-1T3B TaxID=2886941 RepID=UPI001D122994|nr:T9SS type A sorting domain-containing protein [Hymenobacter sp. 15J16-1T3B]MCC3155908.1 T9SS type A sorting domain-containing protein [Hymenobacter sp. 15J16-1T3B]